MNNAYQQLFSNVALLEAWRYVFKNARPASRKTVGVDGVSIDSFEREHPAQIRALHRELTDRRFAFQALRPLLLQKANGKDRLICVPTVRDRVVQRTLLDYLSKKYGAVLANKISYGFLPKRSVQDAAAVAIRLRRVKRWVFKTDITSFFDQIQRPALESRVRAMIRETSLHEILGAAIRCEIGAAPANQQRRLNRLGVHKGVGIRQGMPISPFFANVVLRDFDAALIRKGFQAVRYADDLIFFCSSEDECREIAAYCSQLLSELGLQIPDISDGTKSVIYAPSQPAEFLGLTLAPSHTGDTYELMLSALQVQRIREEMNAMSSVDELSSRGVTFANLLPTIRARASGYLHAYETCGNYSEVEKMLDRLVERSLRKLYVEGLGIDLGSLSKKAYRFLGL